CTAHKRFLPPPGSRSWAAAPSAQPPHCVPATGTVHRSALRLFPRSDPRRSPVPGVGTPAAQRPVIFPARRGRNTVGDNQTKPTRSTTEPPEGDPSPRRKDTTMRTTVTFQGLLAANPDLTITQNGKHIAEFTEP